MSITRTPCRIFILLAAVLALATAPAGAQDFSRYVALGDSLTAGFASGGLAVSAQQNSYPALIHRQAAGGAGFEQPLVSDPGIPSLLTLRSLSPLVIAPRAGQGVPLNLNLPRPYDNLGVPGATVNDLLTTSTGGLHDLILRPSGFGNTTALQQALLLQPTFVTLWIGNNDALGAATSGIVIDGVTLTPLARFEADYRAIVGALNTTGAGLAMATIPNVTAIPFVTTIPPFVINPATSEPVLINGQPVPLLGPDGPLGAADRVLLTASGALAQGIGIPAALGGTGQPLGTELVLSAAEANVINQRVGQYNAVIRAVANESGAALVDVNAIFDDIAAHGIEVGGVEYTTDFLTGGFFSYDGVHASTFGYAFIANAFIEAINQQLGASIPLVDLFPFTFTPDPASAVFASEVKSVRFTRTASESLRKAMGVPSTADLLAILAAGGGDEPPRGPRPPRPRPGAGDGETPAGAQDRPAKPSGPPRPGRGGRG